MLSFVAITRGTSHQGAWSSCVDWCRAQVADHPKTITHILLVRGGERQGRVVAEFTADGERRVDRGRLVPLKQVSPCRRD